MKILFLLPIIVGLLFLVPQTSYEHRSGCHAAHSCPSDTGSYTCGDKGIDTYCPKYTPQKVTDPPKQELQNPKSDDADDKWMKANENYKSDSKETEIEDESDFKSKPIGPDISKLSNMPVGYVVIINLVIVIPIVIFVYFWGQRKSQKSK